MSRRTNAPKRLYYKEDYVSYWNSKGDYGRERVRRMLERKKKRVEKSTKSCRCGNRKKSRDYHVCPFSYAMYGGGQLCRCCEECTHDCAMDV